MRAFVPLTLAAAALASLATPSLAESPYLLPPPAFLVRPAPSAPSVADVTNPGYVYAQPDGAGQYDCQLGERRTRLQREACGPLKNRLGD